MKRTEDSSLNAESSPRKLSGQGIQNAGSRIRSHPSNDRGIALILTLGVIALVTLLMIGFAVSMRVENAAAKNFNDVIKARELARGAVDQAVAQIRQATPARTATPVSTYVTFPGAVYDFNATPQGLYSTATFPGGTTNLTAGLWITGGTNSLGEFSTVNPQIIAGWTYIAQNPLLAPSTVNPIIGRYAFWVDDEASKINVNKAGVGTVPADGVYASAQKEFDLRQLLQLGVGVAPNIQLGGTTYPRGVYPYTTIDEVQRADSTITADVFDDNRFSVTAYSDDSYYPGYTADLDVFGRQRLLLNPTTLNTKANIEGGGDGANQRLQDSALLSVCSSPGSAPAFADPSKYGATGLEQIIANIIAYQIDPGATPPPDGGPAGLHPVYLGLAKTPYINEVQVSYVITPPTVTRSVSVELFYMYDNTYTPGTEQITVFNLPTAGGLFSSTATIVPPAGGYASGTYRTCTEPAELAQTLTGSVIVNPSPTATQVTYERQYAGVYSRLDYAEMNLLQVNLDPAVPTTVNQDAQADDPAVNDVDGQWTESTTSGSLGTGAYPSGHDVSKVVMRAAPMQSVGELGLIHTPVPWKHLTLQPGGGGGVIPDWAILDIFAVDPAVVPKPTLGRMNINSSIHSWGSGGVPTAISALRLVPLKALLSGLAAAGSEQNIYNGNYADTFGNAATYDTIGEICQVTGMADNLSLPEKDREEAIRRIANLITVRSNAFTIWVIAQSIKDRTDVGTVGTFDATDLIAGEVRAQAVVERYEDSTIPVGNPNRVKFRVRYFRYL